MRGRIAAVLLGVCLLCTSCQATPTPATREFTALDTLCSVKIYDGQDALLDKAVGTVTEYEALWSRTMENSDIARMNAADGEAVTIDENTAELLEQAIAWSNATDGAFDITVAPCKELWEAATDVPTDEALAAAKARVGIDKLKTAPWRLTDGAQLDLGAIAKGAIADKVCERLLANGCTSALIDLGGNITAFGRKPDGSPFRVAIADPLDPSRTVLTVEAADVTLSTSGSYNRYYELDGVRYSHILDPSTGRPVDNDLRAVTVIARRGADADALSTACLVMGFDRAWAFLQTLDGIEAIFVKTDGAVITTDGVVTV